MLENISSKGTIVRYFLLWISVYFARCGRHIEGKKTSAPFSCFYFLSLLRKGKKRGKVTLLITIPSFIEYCDIISIVYLYSLSLRKIVEKEKWKDILRMASCDVSNQPPHKKLRLKVNIFMELGICPTSFQGFNINITWYIFKVKKHKILVNISKVIFLLSGQGCYFKYVELTIDR